MNFETAREAFCKLVEDLDKEHLADFFCWIQSTYLVSHCRGEGPAIAYTQLRDIADDLKMLVPFNAILPSEHVVTPEKEEEDPRHIVHVDAFLFEESDIDELVNENKLQRNYCEDCHSHKTAPLTYLTHSISRQRLDFIFSGFIPYLDSSKMVLDVGSRLGGVLYGAYYHSSAGNIVGIEINKELCEVQTKIVEKHKLGDRIKIICNDVRKESKIVSKADVVILNNVFEHFMPLNEQISCWKFLASNIKKGAILLTIPSLEESLENLNTGIDLKKWVSKRLTSDPLFAMSVRDHDELSEIISYDVLRKC